MELPACLEEYEPELVLTVDDRRELIKGLAESGPKSIGKYISKLEHDRSSGIAKLIRRLRSRVAHQVKRAHARILQKYKSRYTQVEKEFSDYLEPTTSELVSNEATSEYIDSEIDNRLLDILSNDSTLNLVINLEEEAEETVLGWWTRLRDAFRRFIRYLAEAIRRFITWFKGKIGRKDTITQKEQRRGTSILLNYPSGSKLWDQIDKNIGNALATSPSFKQAIDRDLAGKGRATNKIGWQRQFDREGYDEQIRRALNQRIKRAIKREQRRLAQEVNRKQRRIKQLRQDKTQQELRKRETASKLRQLEKQKAEELNKLKHKYRKQIQRTVKNVLESELEDAGYVYKEGGEKLKITSRLIDRFAEIVLSDEIQKLPSKHSRTAGSIGLSHGIYEKKKLRMSAESSRMDIVASMVNARLAHPTKKHIYDSDIITHIDVRSTVTHVVLIFDKSGSMEENDRITAAKRAVLALYKAVKHRNPRNIVDFIAFDSTVQVMDILQAWRSSPSGFTNTGEALSTARMLIRDSPADSKLIYLITDGLPEAYTDPHSGTPRAGDLDKSLRIAVTEAKKLKKIARLKLTLILLEPKETIYTDAARTITKAAGGDVMVTDPKELATEMLMDYIEV